MVRLVGKRVLLVVALAVTVGASGVLVAQEVAPALRYPDWSGLVSGPSLPFTARSVILVDVETRTVLFADDPYLVVPPASLTKVATIDVALSESKRGALSIDSRSSVGERAWASSQPPRSSLMFLGPGQTVSLRELLLGLSVSSGNDAAVEVATRVAGSVPAFAALMNRAVAARGIVDLHFVEPSGLSERNTVTADGFARFLLGHIRDHPEAIDSYYSIREFSYPGVQNGASGSQPPVLQFNRNGLLWDYEGADGFKTGFIEASGYNIAVTAERSGRRLIAVVLGVDAPDAVQGSDRRERVAAALLDYGYGRFDRISFRYPEPGPVRIFGGADRLVVPSGPEFINVSVPVGAASELEGRLEQADAMVWADEATRVGIVEISIGDELLGEAELIVPPQPRAGWFGRLWDSLALALARLSASLRGEAPPLVATED